VEEESSSGSLATVGSLGRVGGGMARRENLAFLAFCDVLEGGEAFGTLAALGTLTTLSLSFGWTGECAFARVTCHQVIIANTTIATNNQANSFREMDLLLEGTCDFDEALFVSRIDKGEMPRDLNAAKAASREAASIVAFFLTPDESLNTQVKNIGNIIPHLGHGRKGKKSRCNFPLSYQFPPPQ